MNFSKTGAAYIRVSTDDQLDYSPESQRDELLRYANHNRIFLPEKYIFLEQEGVSGKKADKRAEFQRMIATAKQTPKPFDVILVWKFSRFARNQDESTFYKGILRKKLGIDVVSISEPVLDGMYGRLIEMIIEWQDEFYSYNLGMEVRRGMKKKAELGLYNSKMPLGYVKKQDEMPSVYEPEADIVRMIFDQFTSGTDRNAIVRYLNDHGFRTKTGKAFHPDGILYILENPFYIGKIRWNRRASNSGNALKDEKEWIIRDAHHPALITSRQWDDAQKRLHRSREIRLKYSHPVSHAKHWLSGLVKCSVCGKSLSWKSGYQNGSNTFQCLGYRMGIHNESQSVSERKLTAAVLESLHTVLQHGNAEFEQLRSQNNTSESELLSYSNELSKLDCKEKRIRQAYLEGIDTLDEYRENKTLLNSKRAELHALIDKIKSIDQSDCKSTPSSFQNISSVIDILEGDVAYEIKAAALRAIIKKIVFFKQTNTLKFFYYIS